MLCSCGGGEGGRELFIPRRGVVVEKEGNRILKELIEETKRNKER